MFKYNKELNLLKFYKTETPDLGDRLNCLRDVKASFQKFLDKGVFEAVEIINELLRESGVVDKFIFTSEHETGYWQDEPHVIIYGQVPGRPKVRVIALPYMDSLGKLHFYGSADKVKILVNKLVSSDDVSYDKVKNRLSVVLSKRTIRMQIRSNTVIVEGARGNTISLPVLIDYLQFKEGRNIDIRDYIRNPLLQASMMSVTGKPNKYAVESVDNSTRLISNLMENEEYTATKIREVFNQAVSTSRALGERLSRPVLGYMPGTFVTPAVIEDIQRNRINCFYIKSMVPAPKKKLSGGIGPGMSGLSFTTIPKGTRVTPYLEEFLEEEYPEYSGCGVMPESILCAGPKFQFINKYATKDVLEFLESMGCEGVLLGGNRVPYYFETEVLGNYTFFDSGLKQWVYCKDNQSTTNYDKDHLTSEDLLALLSTLGYIMVSGKDIFMDKDKDLLKSVDMGYEILTRALKRAVQTHVRIFRNSIKEYIRGTVEDRSYIFSKLTDTFIKVLFENGDIDSCDTTNFVAEISQATHLTKKVKEAPETMRHIAVPYYGRICPFETPEGKQLGLVNNKALGCCIVDGEMRATVRKVIKNGDETISIADKIEELPVRDGMVCRVSDISELTPTERPNVYADTRITAIVPNPEASGGDRLGYAKIMASDLDYVSAFTEGFISPVVSLIPFACADDAVRVSFGSKMIKSAIYLLDPDIPRVQTSMYRDIFKSSDAYLLRAEGSGAVTVIESDSVSILYDGDRDETVYTIKEFKVTKDAVVLMRYKVRVGERVSKGQILVDAAFTREGIYCPGKNELIGYMSTGYVYEDAVHVSERASIDFISIGSVEIKKSRDKSSSIDTAGMFKYYKRGEQITTITKVNARGDRQTVPVHTEHGSGIWYNQKATVLNGRQIYKLSLLGYNKLQSGDKMAGLHGNKGVTSKVSNNSEMPMLANGVPLKMFANPHGLPSRMNVGQIKEGHLGLIAHVLGIYAQSDAFNGASNEEVQMFMKMTYELANCEDASRGRGIAISYGMPDDLADVIQSHMSSIMDWAGTFDEYGDAKLWNPVTQEWFPFKVTIAVSTMLKLKQEAETKIHTRSGMLEESYRVTTSQPPKGGVDGGQAMGEMELVALMAYGASNMLWEICNPKSDNETERCNSELSAIDSPVRIPGRFSIQRSTANLIYFLEAFGLILEGTDNELPDTDRYISRERYMFRVKELIQNQDKEESKDYAEDGIVIDSILDSLK